MYNILYQKIRLLASGYMLQIKKSRYPNGKGSGKTKGHFIMNRK